MYPVTSKDVSLTTREDGSGRWRCASNGKKEGDARCATRGKQLAEIKEAKLHRQYSRQNDGEAIEPCADSTLVLIVTLFIVIVFGKGGKQEYREVGREYRHHEKNNRMNPSGGKKHPAVSS